ncbi:MAG: HypC/HybG/HupF family hydrogenase formation chaperone [Cyanobacteria bacterium]|nr:HypC/HybG/HupF family hydrogenase formation chaperone [Cyanobacteriota bacterium]
MAITGELIAIEERPPAGAPADDAALWRVGLVSFAGVQREVSLACVPAARLGDQLLVHVGFALGVVEDTTADDATDSPAADPADAAAQDTAGVGR